MKKFNYFLSIAFTFLLSITQLSAFANSTHNNLPSENIENVVPGITNDLPAVTLIHNSSREEIHVVSSISSNFIQDNLNLLYAICIALVLFNLAAQIKIIVQIVHLFFQFQKKDEFMGLNI